MYSMKKNTIPDPVKKALDIFSIFQIPRLPQHREDQKKRLRRETVRQVSKREVCLSLGYYVTEEEIDHLKYCSYSSIV